MNKRCYKVVENGKLLLIGIGEGGEEITQEEYEALLEEIRKNAVTTEIYEEEMEEYYGED